MSVVLHADRARGATIVDVDEELDLMSLPELERGIAEARERVSANEQIIVSLEKCSYCDSSNLHALLRAWKALGKRLSVVVPPASPCDRVFQITGLARLPFTVASVAEAVGVSRL